MARKRGQTARDSNRNTNPAGAPSTSHELNEERDGHEPTESIHRNAQDAHDSEGTAIDNLRTDASSAPNKVNEGRDGREATGFAHRNAQGSHRMPNWINPPHALAPSVFAPSFPAISWNASNGFHNFYPSAPNMAAPYMAAPYMLAPPHPDFSGNAYNRGGGQYAPLYANYFYPPQQYTAPHQQPHASQAPPQTYTQLRQPSPAAQLEGRGGGKARLYELGQHGQHLNGAPLTAVQPNTADPKAKELTKAQRKAKRARDWALAQKEEREFRETRGQEQHVNLTLGRTRAQALALAGDQPPVQVDKQTQGAKASKSRDPKIMLPAPQPTAKYLENATGEPFVVNPPQDILVVLDLNGTLIHRPRRSAPTRLIERPFLAHFLRYLFKNFSVMVWSSAKPENVDVLVGKALNQELRKLLVACWGRDSFGLAPALYNQNVQVYKNLNKIWESSPIQMKHPAYENSELFDQHNTVLIDDTSLKATAQPYNLVEIPEFVGSPEQLREDDVLREVAGYLEVLRMHNNVSSFMRKSPFKADGTWQLDWE
ncbi:HAD-like domain-containing protein [Clohesyomyces aquaticus]|uniref:Mitochondrial import inner membrane translocase subunit TIM50 n=1 Tax=Clohesyomyces aquaticus TaxID=1231657 RepID=A0A1Y2A5Y7_9PLEO|nr:HAD-like domain-containing protein [Clohesyomyces aquaticus]